MGVSGFRFDKDGLSLDAIAEVFLHIDQEHIHFSAQAHQDNDIKRAQLRSLYRDVNKNHAASMFFMEHP
jgi:hypothetical protein